MDEGKGVQGALKKPQTKTTQQKPANPTNSSI